MRGVVEQVVAEKVDDGEKEKKKKRRSGRRPKQNNSSSVSCSSVNEMRSEASNCLGNDRATNRVTTSLKQQNLETCPSGEQELTKASNVAFNSMPPMHIDEHANSEDIQNLRDRNPHSSDPDGRMFSKSCPESIAYGGLSDSFINGDFPHPHWMEGYAPKKYFAPHWPLQAVNDALEKGDVFKAIFRVNAYNRLEAYCQIDGVPTDVLINGIPSQNRAVEGDIVAVKVEPLSLWTRMKGLAGNCNNSRPVVDFNILPKESDLTGNNCKGKNKADVDCEYANHKSNLFPEKESSSEKSTLCGPIHLEPTGPSSYDQVDGCHLSASESSHVGSYTGQAYVKNAVERMCDMISSYPLRRPTGRVLAVIEGSPRRDAIVGFLNIKQWFSYWEFFTKDGKKSASVRTDRGYIQLAATDPKFPKMMVPVQGLPDPVKRRLENGDATLEMELVAAKIDNWGEESLLPQASILHTFGRGGEIESQLNAILFENSICPSEFSPNSLSCLPNLPWEIPLKELQSRKDLRNLCLFTIDPSTSTDLDDALSVENLPNGIYRVGIHIADVSYFVLPDTELDKEAQIRSTSIYMLQKKIPMLPPLLSENIGSLNPGVDRLAFSVFLDLNLAGDIVDQWIGRTVIRSCCKLSYEHAQDIIDGSTNLGSADFLGDGYPQLHGHFEWFDVIRSIRDLYQLSNILRDKRFNDGALGLESAKIAFLFDEYGIPYDSRLCERKGSNFLVEEFMLLANRTAAETISRAFPDTALLRRHPEPNMRKLKNFEAFCCKHGLELDASSSGKFHLSLQKIREKLKDDSSLFDILINYAARPMQLATYFCSGDLKDSEKDWGHYALAAPLYTHFTSPLRRYPDIVVHRTLAAVIDAEELYLKRQKTLYKLQRGEEVTRKCFSGVYFEKNAAESLEGREALSAAALKHGVPDVELLADVAAYCNGRKLASRRVKDACDKLYMWAWLKKKEILLSEARVLSVGPRFMSVYIQKLAIERQIYYDEVESLIVEWLDATSTLVFNLFPNRRPFRRGSPGKWRPLEGTALVVSPCDLNEHGAVDEDVRSTIISNNPCSPSEVEIEPAVFPLTVHLLSTIPVALHAIGGDDGPLEIGVRLYMSSYFR